MAAGAVGYQSRRIRISQPSSTRGGSILGFCSRGEIAMRIDPGTTDDPGFDPMDEDNYSGTKDAVHMAASNMSVNAAIDLMRDNYKQKVVSEHIDVKVEAWHHG